MGWGWGGGEKEREGERLQVEKELGTEAEVNVRLKQSAAKHSNTSGCLLREIRAGYINNKTDGDGKY